MKENLRQSKQGLCVLSLQPTRWQYKPNKLHPGKAVWPICINLTVSVLEKLDCQRGAPVFFSHCAISVKLVFPLQSLTWTILPLKESQKV